MKHVLTLIVCAAVLAWSLPLSACPGPDIDAGCFASGARSQMAADLQDANVHDLLARGGGRGQGKGDGSGSGQCDGSGSGQGKGKGYGAKDGTDTPERPQDGTGYGAGSGSGTGECPRDGSGKGSGQGSGSGNR